MHFTLSDLVTDITQNSCEADAHSVELDIAETESEFRFTVKDNGKGMSKEVLSRAFDPFVSDGSKHPYRKVGLGLPFLLQTAEQSGSGWHIASKPGRGTVLEAWFNLRTVDMPPIGDIAGMVLTVLLFPGPTEFIVRRSVQTELRRYNWEVRKTDLLEILENLEKSDSLIVLNTYLRSQEKGGEGKSI
ncbi:MAG: sensor histidine kinase [Spirochaetaceae bacterium]|jgi:hypothetical protein|nr:sensor histidine kinase [Spirochaetaceae bacterium]